MNLKDKIAVVTGASRGIGREAAIELAKEGCLVLLISRDENKLKETKELVEKAGGKAELYMTDLNNLDSLNQTIKKIKRGYPHIDFLINIAGVWHSDTKPYFDISYQDFDDEAIIFSLNVGIRATMLLAKAFIPLMKAGGRIINTSGTFGKGEKPDIYEKGCMADLVTKKAIEVFTKQLAYELEGTGINVNAICPWYVWTENVQKFYPETEKEAIPVNKVARQYIDLLKSDKTGEIVVIRP